MAQAAAMLTGLIALWFMLAPSADGAAGAIGIGAAALAFGAARWLMGKAPAMRGARLRIGRFKRGGGILQAAFAPGRLKPGFVKIKARDEAMSAALARAAAQSGAVVVEVEADGLLVHALDEEAIEALARAVEREAA
ncbi:MAG: hypothetical protein JNJ73_00420 [Hyphomonadaceae bacterium]|nr:hypothetical protein [Hyphomonadaceae bacterium]